MYVHNLEFTLGTEIQKKGFFFEILLFYYQHMTKLMPTGWNKVIHVRLRFLKYWSESWFNYFLLLLKLGITAHNKLNFKTIVPSEVHFFLFLCMLLPELEMCFQKYILFKIIGFQKLKVYLCNYLILVYRKKLSVFILISKDNRGMA